MKSIFVTGVLFGALMILCIVTGFVLYTKTATLQARSTCSMFLSQPEAQAAYTLGARYLDADGDGVACEDLVR